MNPMTLPLPLRETTAWNGYRTSAVIPHRYGATGGTLLQYDATRLLFVWADHVCSSVDAVYVGGVKVEAWDWFIGTDSTDTVVTFVRFAQPVAEGAEAFARGRGKLHPVTGDLMQTPGVVTWDILNNICGWEIDQARLADFDRTLDVEIGGSLDNLTETTQTVLRSIAESCGALFAIDSPKLLHVYPPLAPGIPFARVLRDPRVTVTSVSDIADMVNDLTVNYDIQGGSPQGSVRVGAAASIARYGARAATLDARWLVRARDALALALRRVKVSARPNHKLAISGIRNVLNIGDTIKVDHPVVALSALCMVLTREVNLQTLVSSVTTAFPAGDEPTVTVISQASKYETASYASGSIETIGDDRVITLTEGSAANNAPIVGAAVTLTVAQGAFTRTTDSAGKVSFPAYLMPPGEYVLDIETADGGVFEWPVTI